MKVSKIYGPYISSKDSRSRCIIVYDDGSKRTISYPRLIVEEFLGVELQPDEDVHHIDGDITNNDISNLEVVYKSSHIREHTLKYRDEIELPCYYCGHIIKLDHDRQQQRAIDGKAGKVGPFCSKKCSGKYGAEIQNGKKY